MSFCLFGFGYNGFQQIKTTEKSLWQPVKLFEDTARPDLFFDWSTTVCIHKEKTCLLIRGFSSTKNVSTEKYFDLRCLPGNLKTLKRVLILDGVLFVWFDDKTLRLYSFDNDTHLSKEMPFSSNIELKGLSLVKIEQISVLQSSNIVVMVKDEKVIQCKVREKEVRKINELHFALPVKKLSCGKDHQVLVTKDGQIYAWGIGSRGQIGNGALTSMEKPALVEALDGVKIIDACCGGWHTLALAESQDVYSWGWNESGQTGFPAPTNSFATIKNKSAMGDTNAPSTYEPIAMVTTPLLVELENYVPNVAAGEFVQVRSISCGTRHSAVVTSRGMVVTWGWGEYGQLGHSCCVMTRSAETSVSHGCNSPVHGPAVAVWFVENGHFVDGVFCGPWNTFVVTKISR